MKRRRARRTVKKSRAISALSAPKALVDRSAQTQPRRKANAKHHACAQQPSSHGAERCLHQLFERQADRYQTHIAVQFGQEQWSYQRLEHAANQLAHWLRRNGIGRGMLVAIFLERSVQVFTAMLAALKAGAAYVVIDPTHPIDRIDYMLSNAQVDALVSKQTVTAGAPLTYSGKHVLLDVDDTRIAALPTTRLARERTGVLSSDLCYIIYTSGSTGQPKGVMIEHSSVVNYLMAINEIYGVGHNDRVFQGFSLVFDGAVEEIWLAFANGATLVAATQDIVHSPNDVARYLTRESVTVYSTVPTFLSMMEEDLPTVRLLILGGERCSVELVKRWQRNGRRMLNTYGPAEATVVATCAECSLDTPAVSIGRPLRGVQVHVFDEQMRRIGGGEVGELYIGGKGLARGYVNRPELTQQYFKLIQYAPLAAPRRLYRTGDLVRVLDDGNLEFVGRADEQIKIRGFRVELSEIETVLAQHPQIKMSAANVFDDNGVFRIAAYVVTDTREEKEPNNGTLGGDKPAQPLDVNSIIDLLHTRLPDYMMPEYLEILESFPLLPSGKINRKALPKPASPLVRTGRGIKPPDTPLEQALLTIWSEVIGISPISIDDDFFNDLGGHSLLAAKTVNAMRDKLGSKDVSVRDIYAYPSIRSFAARLSKEAHIGVSDIVSVTTKAPSASVGGAYLRRAVCFVLQSISLYALYGLIAFPLAVLIGLFIIAPAQWPLSYVFAAFGVLFFGIYPLMLGTSIVVKWLVIGRYRPGRYPVWGWYYFRWWLVTRMQMLSGAGLIAGTPLMSLYYRLMGAKVGVHCTLDTSHCRAFDLITIGDETSIGAETQLLGCRVQDGELIVGPVSIGKRCFIGNHSALGINSGLQDNARLGDLSLLADDQVVPAFQSWRGSPAQYVASAVAVPQGQGVIKQKPLLYGAWHLLLLYIGEALFLLSVVPSVGLVYLALDYGGSAWGWASLVIAGPLGTLAFAMSVVAAKKLLLSKMRPGVYCVYSGFYLRKWFIDGLLNASRAVLLPLYATLYLPPWLRMLGAKLGARAEVSTVAHISPDLLIAGDESFFADAAIVGGMRFHLGFVEIGENHIGSRSFVGNSAMLPVGAALGDNCLIGCLSISPEQENPAPHGSEWLGSPSFELPHRPVLEGFGEELLYRPSPRMFRQRLLVDGLRIVLPAIIMSAAVFLFVQAFIIFHANLDLWLLAAVIPALALVVLILEVLAVAIVKWLVMGRYRPVVKPLWSHYVWLNELINGLYESVAAPGLALTLGSSYFTAYLRLLGCRIGRGVMLDTSLFSEFDLVRIGDNAALNMGATVQTHLFEDRIMKSSYLTIGKDCSVGNMAVVLYDTEMQDGSSIGPMSLLMKGETIAPHTRWHGIPIRRAMPA